MLLLPFNPVRQSSHQRQKYTHTQQTPDKLLPKVFGELRERYADRPGGYTRVLRIEPLNRTKLDQAESAILEFVDGKVDTRFAMTAAAVARSQVRGRTLHPTTQLNVKKVTAFRKNGKAEFRALVEAIKKGMPRGQVRDIDNAEYTLDEFEKRKKVYEAKLQAYHEYKEQRDLEYKQKREGRGARQRRLRREKKGIVQSEEEGEEPFLNAGEGKGEGQKQPRRSAPRAEELEHDIAASEWEDVDEAAVSHEEARARPKKRAVTGRGANKLQWKYPPKKPKLPLKYRAEKPTRAAPVKASF